MSLGSRASRPAGLDDFADWVEPAHPAVLCEDLYKRFSEDPDLLSVPIVDGVRPLGLIHRADFMMRLAHNFGRALYGKKRVTVVMDADPLKVDRSLALETVQSTIASSRPCALIQGFIITDEGRYAALGTALSLIRQTLVRAEERAAELSEALTAACRADAAKSTFLATMSHELRTPLTAVIGFSELIAEEAFGPVDPVYVGYANNIRESGEHLFSLVGDILDYAKIENGDIELHEDTVDLGEELARTVRLLSDQASRRSIDLSCVQVSPVALRADPKLLRQMLVNLAGNALKFTDAGGEVRLSLGSTAGSVWFSVSDTGCGMEAEEIEIALQPFRQIDNGLNRSHEGTGLGLPLVKAFAEAHGAQLRLSSARGRGTTATVVFPKHRAAAEVIAA